MTHTASCRCGQLSLTATGEPVRVSVCHCLNCQKRSGSAFAAQVRFPADQVAIEGDSTSFAIAGDSGSLADFHFCPACGATVYFINRNMADTVAVPLGVLDDPHAFRPRFSMFENRKHDWLEIVGPGIGHD